MKKLFLTLALVLTTCASWANVWDAPTAQDMPNETPVYVQVNVNGRAANGNDGIEVAAFIDGQCRADATSMMYTQSQQEWFSLRVMGDLDTESGKTVTFKAMYHGMEFEFTKTITFSGETYTPAPLVLNIDAPTGVKTKPVEVTQPASAFPYELSLDNYAELEYASMDGAAYTPLGESNLVTPIYFRWQQATSSNCVFVEGNKLKINMPIQEQGWLNVTAGPDCGKSDDYGPIPEEFFSGKTSYTITIASTPVTGISADIESLTINAFEGVQDDLFGHITLTPAEADNQSYSISVEGTTPAIPFNGKQFTNGGEYTIVVTPDDQAYEGEPLRIPVTVYVQPTGIACDLNTYNGSEYEGEAHIGDNVGAYLNQHITLTYPVDEPINPVGHITYIVDESDRHIIDKELMAVEIGSAWLTAQLDGTQQSIRVWIDVKSQLKMVYEMKNREFLTGIPETLCYIYVDNPGNEPFDAENIQADFMAWRSDMRVVKVTQIKAIDNTTDASGMSHESCYAVDILAKYGYNEEVEFWLNYDGGMQIGTGEETISHDNKTILIAYGQTLESGWNWISVVNQPVATTAPSVESIFGTAADQNIVEIRSQHELLYNDPVVGYFGDLQYITGFDGCYKVKTAKPMTLNWGRTPLMNGDNLTASVRKGYNWLNVPYDFDIVEEQLEDLFGDLEPAEGDQIITRTGFAEYNGNEWITTSNFMLKTGEGLVYYSTSEEDKDFEMHWMDPLFSEDADVKAEFGQHNVKVADIFNYNAHAYADNMAMVASVEGLQDADNYFVGVFCGDECRGNGQGVEGGKFLINATGRTGEKLTFKLYNKFTGETFDIEGTHKYMLHNGSLKEPVMLSAPGVVTAISSVKGAQNSTNATFDLSGRRVEKAQKGIYIIGGKKVVK